MRARLVFFVRLLLQAAEALLIEYPFADINSWEHEFERDPLAVVDTRIAKVVPKGTSVDISVLDTQYNILGLVRYFCILGGFVSSGY